MPDVTHIAKHAITSAVGYPGRRLISGLLASLVLLGAGHSAAQSVSGEQRPQANFPASDIFLFDLVLAGNTASISEGKNVTAREGYDNQPRFTPDSSSFVFTRGDDYQTDVYEYILDSAELRQLTNSSSMEFSPTPMPDNRALAFVSDRDGSVWLAQRDAVDEPQWVLQHSSEPEAVGYFAWNYARDEMLYWSRYGYSMVLANTETGARRFVAGHCPPATPHLIPGTDRFSFVHRQANEEVWIKELDPDTGAIRPLIMLHGSNYNYAWAPDASILTIQDNVLYRAIPGQSGKSWLPVADLAQRGVAAASRLAVSPNGMKLAIVGVPGAGMGTGAVDP